MDINYSDLGRGIEAPVIVDLMSRALEHPDVLSLAAGFTDNSILPSGILRQHVEDLLREDLTNESLQYGTNQGRPKLRQVSAQFLQSYVGESGDYLRAENCMITNGSQQALYLAMQTLCDRGDIVLVEEPSYFVCLEMLKGLGVELIGMPCDETGKYKPDALSSLLTTLRADGRIKRVKAVYLVTYFCNPTSRSMELGEKLQLAQILKSEELIIPVIEDAAYRELFHEEPHPVPSILSLDAFREFPSLYLGTYTKPLATGLKVGYGFCSNPDWLERMLRVKGHQDFGTSNFMQALVERIVGSGDFEEHLSVQRRHYSNKSILVGDILSKSGLEASGWRWENPLGGLVYWLRGPENLDTSLEGAFFSACIDAGVMYVPGALCATGSQANNCLRLSFGALSGELLIEAVGRFVDVAKVFD